MSKRATQHSRRSSRAKPLPTRPRAKSHDLPAWVAAIILAVSIGVVYGRALDVPFIFDDISTIVQNKSITSLSSLVGTPEHPGPLRPGQQLPTAARPLVNLSFAINYHFGELKPDGYHAINVAIHFLSAVLLLLIVRRTLRLPYFAGRYETSSGWLAFLVAMIWTLHPLQTETVIYATQRTELIFAFFYLATLYCSLRYWASDGIPTQRVLWLTLAVVASLAGMASKEVMVSAPLIVLLFDRTFVAGSVAKAVRRSWPLYVGLAATWLLLFGLLLGRPHSASVGFGIGVTAGEWWLTQTKVLWIYLKLAIWPWPLLIHYKVPYLTVAESWVYVIPTLVVVIAAIILLWRNNPIGYLAVWIGAILAPTFVIPIITEIAAERRMYLPLAALAVVFVLGGQWLFQFVLGRFTGDRQSESARSTPLAVVAAVTLLIAMVGGMLSANRLASYYDDKNLWQEVIRVYPHDEVALYNLGCSLLDAAQLPESIDALQAAREQKPDDVDTLNNLGVALMRSRRFQESYELLKRAAKLEPDAFDVHANLGHLLTRAGNNKEAVDELRTALSLKPDDTEALSTLGLALTLLNRNAEAIEVLERVDRLRPNDVDIHKRLGAAYRQSGKDGLAIEHYRKAIELDPADGNAHFVMGQLLANASQADEAKSQYDIALHLIPDVPEVHGSYADLLRKLNRVPEAIQHYKMAIQLKPDFVPLYTGLINTLAADSNSTEAIATAEKGIEVARSTHQDAEAERLEEWLKHYQTELRRAASDPSIPSKQ